jgi:hypothetical protein
MMSLKYLEHLIYRDYQIIVNQVRIDQLSESMIDYSDG